MQTFDYTAAWIEQSKPGWETLPANVRDLVAYTAEAAGELRQLPDCSMPWPDGDGEYRDLRARFDAIPAEVLAAAARIVYTVGHWYPGKVAGGYVIPGRESGGTWKFAHYADQSLRARLGIRTTDDPGITLRVHEGVIRLCYSSKDMWTWHEVQPATEGGKARALVLADELRAAIRTAQTADGGGHTMDRRYKRQDREIADSAAYAFIEALRAKPINHDDWPGVYFAGCLDTARYMGDEAEINLKYTPPTDWAKEIAKVRASFAKRHEKLTTEEAGLVWLLEHQIPTDNAIYYDHTGRWCFGWRHPLTRAAHLQYVEQLGAEFPYPYDYKYAPGYDPSRVEVG